MKGLQQRVQDPPLQLRGEPSVCPGPWAPRPLLTRRGGGGLRMPVSVTCFFRLRAGPAALAGVGS